LLRTRPTGEHQYEAAKVVAAIGDMHRPRMLGVRGENLPHVSHYLADPHRYFGRRVLIVGGKNSAVEAAIRLHRVGAAVTISYRRDGFDADRIKYWLLPEIRGLIKSGHVAFHPRTVPAMIERDAVVLAPVRETGDLFEPDVMAQRQNVAADDVLLLTGYEMDASLLEAAGVELAGDQRAPRFDPRTMETNVPGLYVAGTATAGTQKRFRVFIENCHDHAQRIASHILGRAAPQAAEPRPVAALEM
jgi:thioredoxin reductase (NADPH)